MSKKFLERLKRRRPDLARIAEKIDHNTDTDGPRSDTSSSSSSSSSADSSPDSDDESDIESKQTINQRSFDQGDEPMSKKQRVSSLQ